MVSSRPTRHYYCRRYRCRQVEAAVKRIFADIPAPTNPAKREYTEVADNDEPLVSIATDKEASNIILSIFYKHDKMPKELYATGAGLMKDYMENVVETMINERFAEMMQKANPLCRCPGFGR